MAKIEIPNGEISYLFLHVPSEDQIADGEEEVFMEPHRYALIKCDNLYVLSPDRIERALAYTAGLGEESQKVLPDRVWSMDDLAREAISFTRERNAPIAEIEPQKETRYNGARVPPETIEGTIIIRAWDNRVDGTDYGYVGPTSSSESTTVNIPVMGVDSPSSGIIEVLIQEGIGAATPAILEAHPTVARRGQAMSSVYKTPAYMRRMTGGRGGMF